MERRDEFDLRRPAEFPRDPREWDRMTREERVLAARRALMARAVERGMMDRLQPKR